MSTTPTLPTGALASDLSWNDEPQLSGRVTFHEARLGLPPRQTEYVDAANYYLRTIAISHNKAEAEDRLRAVSHLPELTSVVAAEAAQETAWELRQAGATRPTTAQEPANGYRRLVRAFTGAQPAQVGANSSPSSVPVPAAPPSREPIGVSRLAACYARTARTSRTTT